MQIRYGNFGEEMHLCPSPEKLPSFMGLLARSLDCVRLHVLGSLYDVKKTVQLLSEVCMEWLISSSAKSANLYLGSCNYFGVSGLTIFKEKNNLLFLKLIERKQIIRESSMEMCCTVSETGFFHPEELFSLFF